ncbi:NPCBM/NEW2 domain-containing protein [uncultured Akkermansia sp.]|uniref:NPCBM/NEW2 domain-containing protein n=1 Tax=uncultured Akkermansia sp. TaxID=512294 RepID=UPI00265CDBF5|nr:NPCBM/NEW2 domain-containing protein [uncultured Akkermansia sp.]
MATAWATGLFPMLSPGLEGAGGGDVMAVEVPAASLLMARQETGETRLNRSFKDKELSVGGKKYATGIGTHATSMIPLPIPGGDGARVASLEGACGIDDGTDGDGSVEFRVMSGSEVLWSSGVMKRGMPAKRFSVPVAENGIRHLYLMADRVENNSYDHADWVGLAWKMGGKPQSVKGGTVNGAQFGMVPGVKKDQGPALRSAISALRKQGGGVLTIPRGVYHFYPEGALNMSFNISNHDQPLIHPVCVPLTDLRNVRVEGNGSLFLFHGKVIPLLVMDSENVSINRLAVDYERSWCTEARVVNVDDKSTEVEIDKKTYPYEIRNDRFVFLGEGWEEGMGSCMAFEKGTGHIIANTSDIGWNGRVEPLGGNRLRLDWDLKQKGIKQGDTLVLRNYNRPHPGCVVYRAQKTRLEDVAIHQSSGMALLVQRSKDFLMKGGGVFIRKGTGRVHTAGADATHFSNTRGEIIVEKALFEGMMDDAINVHSTCLGITEVVDSRTLKCRYMHGQAVGFEVFLPGEKIRFINGPTLEPGSTGTVKTAVKKSSTELVITLEEPLPAEVKAGDAVENADFYPSVVFRNNIVRNNRARGSLFTTPERVLVEGNLFDHSSGSAILLAGDAQGWYESGACHEVVIRRNTFINNLTSRYQFTNAIISIYPEVKQLDKQKAYYHRNVLIESNVFKTFDVPLLFAISTDHLKFINNRIIYNKDFKGWGQKPFQFRRCADILIKNNKVQPPRTWTIEDCKLENTPADQVRVEN